MSAAAAVLLDEVIRRLEAHAARLESLLVKLKDDEKDVKNEQQA